jgi:tetratricopeptide (TPR) repeat protein
MTEGRTQPAEKLILQHISKNVSADEELFLRATFTLSKVENLGLPANLHLILALFQFEKTIPATVLPALQVSLKLCIANGELHQAKFLAEALLQGIAMSTTAPPPYPALGPTEFDTLANLARIHNALGEYDAALRTLEQMDQHPFNVAEIAREIRFATYFAKFRETGAPDWEAKATSTASTALEHAALRTSRGQRSLLLAELRKQAKDDGTRFRLAVALLNEGLRTGDRTKMEEAISICRAPLPATRFETVRYRRCALVAAEAEFFLGREKESLKSYMAVWPLDKLELGAVDRAEVLLLLGNLALRRFRDFRAARDYFREAMELVSGEKAVWGEGFDVTTMAALGYAAVRSGDTAEGLAEFSKGYRYTVKESRVDAAVSLAWAFLEAGNLTAARSVLSQREFHDNPRIHVALGLLSHRQGKPREAIDQYLRALGVKGGRPDETTPLYLAMAYLENGEPAKALEHLSRLSGLATPGTCPAAMRKRYIEPGWAWEPRLCEDRVFLEKHITELERRLSENPASVELRDELFVLYRIRLVPRGGSGSDSKARAQLADAIRLDRRDALNAPELTLTPGRRFIDAAVLDLEVGDPRKALQDLRELLAWYVGSPKADLWAFEATRKFDVFAGRRNKEVPAWYVASLTWPESLKP